MSGFVERQFDSGDIAINVAEWADNGPPLLFIHSVTSDWSTWEKIVIAAISSSASSATPPEERSP